MTAESPRKETGHGACSPPRLLDPQTLLGSIQGSADHHSRNDAPAQAGDHGRPILFKRDHGIAGLTCIMGSKIDNVYDVMDFATAVARKELSS